MQQVDCPGEAVDRGFAEQRGAILEQSLELSKPADGDDAIRVGWGESTE
jgi:hypothetical protein